MSAPHRSTIPSLVSASSPDSRGFIAESKAMKRLMEEALIAARCADHPILITGEIGSGKTHLARFIHQNSPRSNGPLEIVDCGTLPELENHLVGHSLGAFTGATRPLPGRLKLADGGILVLDDFDRLSLNQQDLLHRVVIDGEVVPIGAQRNTHTNVRFIAATNKDVRKEVEAGRLRADFISRLDYFHLHVPPLRERLEDLPLLAQELLRKHLETEKHRGFHRESDLEFHPSCWVALSARSFEDNIRGLHKLVVRLAAHAGDARWIHPRDLAKAAPLSSPAPTPLDDHPTLRQVCQAAERDYILKVLRRTRFNVSQAAEALDISRKCLYEKLKHYGITRE